MRAPSRRSLLKSSAALAGGLFAGGAFGVIVSRLAGPNVLLICIDALRADRMGYAGFKRPLTPFIDALAARGTAFTDAVASSSWTKTAVATMLTGLHPFVHSVLDPENPLPLQAVTLQSILARSGYRTFCLQTNPWLGEENHGFARGFGFFRFLSHDMTRGRRVHVPDTEKNAYVDGSVVVERAARVAKLLGDGFHPFLGYVHLMDTHAPYLPPAPYNSLFSQPGSGGVDDEILTSDMSKAPERLLTPESRARLVDLYDGSVLYADELVGRLVCAVDRCNPGKTLFVVCSDHGEELWEHGLVGHAKTLYNEVLKIPLVIAGPGIPKGLAVSDRVRQIDILPTLLGLLDIDADAVFDGASALPLFHGASRDPAQVANLAFLGAVTPVQKRSMETLAPMAKIIFNLKASGTEVELYDLRNDPGERVSLIGGNEPLATKLASEFDGIMKSAASRAHGPSRAEISGQMRERLRALGYLN